MQTTRRITTAEKREYFEKCLKDAVELGLSPEHQQMFDLDVMESLEAVANSYPRPKAALIQKAKEEFEVYMRWLAG